MTKHNPKALNLSALKYADTNVTLGFNCEPELKLQLAKDAEKAGLTLSTYVKYLVMDNIILLKDEFRRAEKRLDRLKTHTSELQQKISFYENDILQNIFIKYKDSKLTYKNDDGDDVVLIITELKDIYTYLINTFEY
jgi:hypothetical protein